MIPWDIGSSSGSCNANEFPEIHRVSKIIRERMHSSLEGVWAGEVRILYVHCVPTACVQVMRPGTCPLHRIRSDGRPRGGSKELRQHGRRRFCQVDWHEMFHSFRHRGARCVARLRPLLPAALLVVDCYSVSASVRVYPLFRGLLRGAGVPGAFCMCTLPPTLLPACTLAAGPCSPA